MNQNVVAAFEMLDAFVSVGCRRFDVTELDLHQKLVPEGWRPGRNVAAMRLMLPHFVPLVWDLHHNLILRPVRSAQTVLAQLDDIGGAVLDRMRSRAFLRIETSPGNYQAWLSIAGGNDGLVRRLVKQVGCDWNASRAVRLAGTPNCKPEYAPDFPCVRIVDVQLGRQVKPAELDLPPDVPFRPVVSGSSNRGWPEYGFFLRGARLKEDGSADLSGVDYIWAKVALRRGFSFDEVVAKLLEVSPKARAEWDRGNKGYARRTVEAAQKAW